MKKTVESYIKEVNELKDFGMKKIMEEVDITLVDTDEFELAKRTLKLLDTSCDLLLEQAEMMDSMNEKLDKLLARKGQA